MIRADFELTAEVLQQIALAQDVVIEMGIAGHDVSLLDLLDALASAEVQLAPSTDARVSQGYFAQLHVEQASYSDGCVGEHQGCAYAQATSPEPHLPECRAAGLGLWPSSGLCICDELRACEQRVDALRGEQ